MKDPELEILIEALESRSDMTAADFDAVTHALAYLLPDATSEDVIAPHHISSTDGAILVVDQAYPNWSVHIQGRANDRDGHWRCTLRENDARDNDVAIGLGRAPVLAQAVLAAVLRLTAVLKKL